MKFSIFGFELDVPKEYYIFVVKDSLYYRGGIDISDHFKHNLKILWDDLDEFKNSYNTPLDFFQSKYDKIKEDKDLVAISSEEFKWDLSKDHPYHFHKISYTTKKRFTKELSHTLIGLVIHCNTTSRYYLLFHEYSENKNEFEPKALSMMKSFNCNCDTE
uniref:Uncharacterized protein n=1 Tax=Candidatus Methanomethylicus mesodigestus TaxID=1867258 RepID=A0A7C3N4R4_9CREN